MKLRNFYSVILMFSLMMGCTARATPPPTRVPAVPMAVSWDERDIFREGLITAEQDVLERLPGASVYHLDVRIADNYLQLEGREEILYTNREDIALDVVYFQVFPNIGGGEVTVSSLKVDDQAVSPIYEYHDADGHPSAFKVPLPEVLEPGERVVIQMDFAVKIPQEMGGNYGLFGYFEDILVLDVFYPVIPVYDDEGWNVAAPSPSGDLTYFDASFYVVRVTAPADAIIVASGIAVEHRNVENQQVLTLAAGPARDFYLAASERYLVMSKTVGETRVNSYALTRHKAHAELALRFTVQALESFNARFGAYPYTEFDVVSTPMRALGIEYPGLVGISLNLYDPKAQVLGLPSRIVLESTVAHEVAHQWFYNVVGNDQVDEPWLDEAVVQYVTGLYYVDVQGQTAARSYRASWSERWNRVERAEIPIGLPSRAYSVEAYSPIVYGRGPLFVTALAEAMGQTAFDAFLRAYYQAHQWDIGTGDAFKRLAEEHCRGYTGSDCDLTALFETWVYEK